MNFYKEIKQEADSAGLKVEIVTVPEDLIPTAKDYREMEIRLDKRAREIDYMTVMGGIYAADSMPCQQDGNLADNPIGFDVDGNPIEEFRILRPLFGNTIDVEECENMEARFYCAVVAEDGNAYAITVYDDWNWKLIRKRENIPDDEDIPTIVKPISEMDNYEVSACNGGEDEFFYTRDRDELKRKLNKILKEKNKAKNLKI